MGFTNSISRTTDNNRNLHYSNSACAYVGNESYEIDGRGTIIIENVWRELSEVTITVTSVIPFVRYTFEMKSRKTPYVFVFVDLTGVLVVR